MSFGFVYPCNDLLVTENSSGTTRHVHHRTGHGVLLVQHCVRALGRLGLECGRARRLHERPGDALHQHGLHRVVDGCHGRRGLQWPRPGPVVGRYLQLRGALTARLGLRVCSRLAAPGPPTPARRRGARSGARGARRCAKSSWPRRSMSSATSESLSTAPGPTTSQRVVPQHDPRPGTHTSATSCSLAGIERCKLCEPRTARHCKWCGATRCRPTPPSPPPGNCTPVPSGPRSRNRTAIPPPCTLRSLGAHLHRGGGARARGQRQLLPNPNLLSSRSAALATLAGITDAFLAHIDLHTGLNTHLSTTPTHHARFLCNGSLHAALAAAARVQCAGRLRLALGADHYARRLRARGPRRGPPVCARWWRHRLPGAQRRARHWGGAATASEAAHCGQTSCIADNGAGVGCVGVQCICTG